jgi:circadian clock protein KaiC
MRLASFSVMNYCVDVRREVCSVVAQLHRRESEAMNKKNKPAGPVKHRTGIAGFDRITGGGLPDNRTTLVIGGPGSGKTVFALQALVSGAQEGQPGLFVSFDEQPRRLIEDGGAFGWNLSELEKERLIFLDARLRPGTVKAGHFDLTGMLAGLKAVASELGAKRVVLDSFDVLLTLLDDRLAELQEVFRLRDWLFENNLTAIVTATLNAHEPRSAQRQALLQMIADCTVSMDFRLTDRAASRHLRVVKYRGSGFVEDEFPYAIGRTGIKVEAPSSRPRRRKTSRTSDLHPEIERARNELAARVSELERFMEMKQAELDFLMAKEKSRHKATLPNRDNILRTDSPKAKSQGQQSDQPPA